MEVKWSGRGCCYGLGDGKAVSLDERLTVLLLSTESKDMSGSSCRLNGKDDYGYLRASAMAMKAYLIRAWQSVRVNDDVLWIASVERIFVDLASSEKDSRSHS